MSKFTVRTYLEALYGSGLGQKGPIDAHTIYTNPVIHIVQGYGYTSKLFGGCTTNGPAIRWTASGHSDSVGIMCETLSCVSSRDHSCDWKLWLTVELEPMIGVFLLKHSRSDKACFMTRYLDKFSCMS